MAKTRRWKLVVRPNFARDREMLGQYVPDRREIIVDPDQETRQLLETLVHEAIHAGMPDAKTKIARRYNLQHGHLEEALVRHMEARVTQCLLDMGMLKMPKKLR